jgi:lipoprotein
MNRIFRSGLFLAALSIVASSCSKNSDAPIDPDHEGPHVEAPVSVALESSLLTYDAKLLEDPQPSGRALDWDPRNSEVTYSIQGSSKDILDDNGQGTGNKSKIAKYNKTLTVTNHPSRDLLMIYKVEAPGKQTQFTYEKASWNYNTRKRAYELVATFNINMPVGISEEDIKNNQASLSVLIIAGGNNFDPQTKHLKVGFAKAASTDVTKTRQAVGAGDIANEVDLPVPYASGWVPLSYNRTENSQRVFVPSGVIGLKPQGVLLTTTIRNNSEKDMQYSGFTLRSNALQFDGEIDLSQSTLRRSDGMTPSGFSVQDYFINTGNKWISNAMCSRDYTPFYEKTYTYDGDRVCQKGGALSEDVIVFWAMPVKGIETATDYTKRIGNTYRPAIGYAQTHVYVNGAKATTGEEITAPNYTIAPVMGTDKALKLGKAYTVNSEFYTQPKQALGYVLKEYFGVNPTRWVDDNSKNLDIPLVSNKKITQYGFQNGLSTSAKGFVQVLTQPWMELLSLYTPMEFIDNTNNDRFAHDPKNQLGRYRALQFKLPYAKTNADPTTFDYRDFVTTDAIDWCNTDQGEGLSYAYRLTYREPNSFGNSKRSPYQCLMRFTARPNKGPVGSDTQNNRYVKYIDIESVYLGKYFVGNLYDTPIPTGKYDGSNELLRAAVDTELWDATKYPSIQKGYITRTVPSAGLYKDVTAADGAELNEPARRSTFDTDRMNFHWGMTTEKPNYITDLLTKEVSTNVNDNAKLVEKFNTTDDLFYRRGFAYGGVNGDIFTYGHGVKGQPAPGGAIYDFTQKAWNLTYQALRLFSTTYQGAGNTPRHQTTNDPN